MNWTDEFQNALAWYASAPQRLVDNAKKVANKVDQAIDNTVSAVAENMQAAAEWIWVVLQGDFAEEQTGAQIAVSTVISMIPFVDQICDVRDLIANCKKIYAAKDNDEESSTWHWVALVLTLIGLFPSLGSFFKGCLKILFLYVRKGIAKAGGSVTGSVLWKAITPYVEMGISKLNDYMARPAVRKTISALHLNTPYQDIAKEIRRIAKSLNTGALLQVMNKLIAVLKNFVDFIKKWGTAALATKAGHLLELVLDVRNKANAKLAKALAPAQEVLDKLATRLDVEHRMMYQAVTGAVNAHRFTRLSLNAETAAIQHQTPKWVDEVVKPKYPALENSHKAKPPHSDIGDAAPKPMKGAYSTFHDIRPDIIPEGKTLVRVVDPGSNDNSICWMTMEEYKKLLTKDDWRRKFAVWANWNDNGQITTYTVPPGGIPVWRGKTASQPLNDANNVPIKNAKGEGYFLEGGAEQLVIDPKHLDQRFLNPREATNWGYGDFGQQTMVGVPELKTNWYYGQDADKGVFAKQRAMEQLDGIDEL